MSALICFRAADSISTGDVVRVTSGGLLTKASAISPNSSVCAGIALNTGSVNDLILVNKDSLYYASSGTYVPGNRAYLSLISGQVYEGYNAFAVALAASTLSGAYLVDLGPFVSVSGLNLEINSPVFVNQ